MQCCYPCAQSGSQKDERGHCTLVLLNSWVSIWLATLRKKIGSFLFLTSSVHYVIWNLVLFHLSSQMTLQWLIWSVYPLMTWCRAYVGPDIVNLRGRSTCWMRDKKTSATIYQDDATLHETDARLMSKWHWRGVRVRSVTDTELVVLTSAQCQRVYWDTRNYHV